MCADKSHRRAFNVIYNHNKWNDHAHDGMVAGCRSDHWTHFGCEFCFISDTQMPAMTGYVLMSGSVRIWSEFAWGGVGRKLRSKLQSLETISNRGGILTVQYRLRFVNKCEQSKSIKRTDQHEFMICEDGNASREDEDALRGWATLDRFWQSAKFQPVIWL